MQKDKYYWQNLVDLKSVSSWRLTGFTGLEGQKRKSAPGVKSESPSLPISVHHTSEMQPAGHWMSLFPMLPGLGVRLVSTHEYAMSQFTTLTEGTDSTCKGLLNMGSLTSLNIKFIFGSEQHRKVQKRYVISSAALSYSLSLKTVLRGSNTAARRNPAAVYLLVKSQDSSTDPGLDTRTGNHLGFIAGSDYIQR